MVKRKAVVLGGYGLIGAACCKALKSAGFEVTGVGRSVEAGRKIVPNISWIACDIARETDWARVVGGADVVVNASGALQDGLRDDLEAIHVGAVKRFCTALEGQKARLIQISAAGVNHGAPTEFYRSKARGDDVIMATQIDHVILRPVLVIGPQAYGGTALLRAVAAVPAVEPRAFADTPVSCVALDDVAQAVVRAALGEVPGGTVADLTEADSRSFAETVRMVREWQGFPRWRMGVCVPNVVLRGIAAGADVLGWIGWRSPLRSTALKQLQWGIQGDPATWRAVSGADLPGLVDILERLPATRQERFYAQTWALVPLAVGVLSLFWLVSGVIGILSFEAAQQVLVSRGVGAGAASAAVWGGIVVDIVLGAALLVRRSARFACLGMVLISLTYLVFGTWLAPDLWADPLGPFVKVMPGMVLALFVWSGLEER